MCLFLVLDAFRVLLDDAGIDLVVLIEGESFILA